MSDGLTARCPACDGSGRDQRESTYGDCPTCRGVGRLPVVVDVPPGTPLHELAALAADAPEVRREVVRAKDLPPGLDVTDDGDGTVAVLAPGGTVAVRLPEAEAARRLLAFDAMLQACEDTLRTINFRLWQRGAELSPGELTQWRDTVAAALAGARPLALATTKP